MTYPAGSHDDPAAAGDAFVDATGDPQLAAFLDRSAAVLGEEPDELTMQRHLHAMRAEAKAEARRGAKGLSMAYRFAGVAAAAGFALVATLAGLGSLPAPAQQVLSDVANRVGISLPASAEDAPGVQRAPGLKKQMPTFDQVPGHAVRDQVGRGGFPKPDGLPERAGPPDDVPGLEGREERPGAPTAPGEAPDGTPGRTDGTPDRPGDVAPEGDAQGDDQPPVEQQGSDTSAPAPAPDAPAEPAEDPPAPTEPDEAPPAPPANAPAPQSPTAGTGETRQQDADPVPEPSGEATTQTTPTDPGDNAP